MIANRNNTECTFNIKGLIELNRTIAYEGILPLLGNFGKDSRT